MRNGFHNSKWAKWKLHSDSWAKQWIASLRLFTLLPYPRNYSQIKNDKMAKQAKEYNHTHSATAILYTLRCTFIWISRPKCLACINDTQSTCYLKTSHQLIFTSMKFFFFFFIRSIFSFLLSISKLFKYQGNLYKNASKQGSKHMMVSIFQSTEISQLLIVTSISIYTYNICFFTLFKMHYMWEYCNV